MSQNIPKSDIPKPDKSFPTHPTRASYNGKGRTRYGKRVAKTQCLYGRARWLGAGRCQCAHQTFTRISARPCSGY